MKRPGPGQARAAAAALAAVCAAALLLSGCWDRVAITNLNVVDALAVDTAPGGAVRLTVSLVLPQNIPTPGSAGKGGAGSGQANTIVVSVVGATLGQADAKLQTTLPGQLFWADARVVVVGASFARRGIMPVVDFFLRNRNTRVNTDVLVTRGLAGPLLEVGPPYRSPSIDFLYQHLQAHIASWAYAYNVVRAQMMTSTGLLLPAVHVEVPRPAGAAPTGSKSGLTAPQFVFAGAGVFDDGRLVGWLDQQQWRGALWLLGRTRPTRVVLHGPGGAVMTSLQDRASIHRRALRLPDGRVAVEVDVDTDGSIEEVDRGAPPLNDPAYVKVLGENLAAQIRRQEELALAAARRMDVDGFGFARLVAAYEAVAFWAFWALTLAWAVAVQTHAPLPTLPDLTRALFEPLWRSYLTPQPDIYW